MALPDQPPIRHADDSAHDADFVEYVATRDVGVLAQLREVSLAEDSSRTTSSSPPSSARRSMCLRGWRSLPPEASGLFADVMTVSIACAVEPLDLDWLTWSNVSGPTRADQHRMMLVNLVSVVANYRAAGVRPRRCPCRCTRP